MIQYFCATFFDNLQPSGDCCFLASGAENLGWENRIFYYDTFRVSPLSFLGKSRNSALFADYFADLSAFPLFLMIKKTVAKIVTRTNQSLINEKTERSSVVKISVGKAKVKK